MLAELSTLPAPPGVPRLVAAAPLHVRKCRGVDLSARGPSVSGASAASASSAATVSSSASAAAAAGVVAAGAIRRLRRAGDRKSQRHRRGSCVLAGAAAAAVDTAAAPPAGAAAATPPAFKARPLQIVKIDLSSNEVVIGEEEIRHIEKALADTGVEKVAIVGVMGAFRTGKSFLLDLMLRYVREKSIKKTGGSAEVEPEECEMPDWVVQQEVPDWVIKCGSTLTEGRELPGAVADQAEGFLWRPGMEKCTEGVWVWSEAFVLKAGDEDVAVLLMDTQGAWDAKMTKEQSATVFGLTTLMTSRLVYNVSKQIQQDKIDNLLYFVDFAQAALRTKELRGLASKEGMRPFQTLEFLVRDWPHYPEEETVARGRDMMLAHLDQYSDPRVSSDTRSMDSLSKMFNNIDIWCLPHPSLRIERESWKGDLEVIEPSFWRFLDEYIQKIFSPSELKVKTTMGTPVTTSSFGPVVREFIAAFGIAAPQAQTFAEAMETSTALLARESAVKLFRKEMASHLSGDKALTPEEFESKAALSVSKAQGEFDDKAIFGDQQGIQSRAAELKAQIDEELTRYRDENQRRLESSLGGLTNATLGAATAFAVDRLSDVTCDWWLPFCQDLSGTLQLGYVLVAAYVALSLNNISNKQGGLNATVAAVELGKGVLKRGGQVFEQAKLKAGELQEQVQEQVQEQAKK